MANPLKVFTLAGANYELTQNMFFKWGYDRALSLQEADFVCFTGGSDVDPEWYGEQALPFTRSDPERDKKEAKVFDWCAAHDVPMVGICRGSQFLHVMNGGHLWQDVNNHCKDHKMVDIFDGDTMTISSTHHQMVRFNDRMMVHAATPEPVSTVFENMDDLIYTGRNIDNDDLPPIEIEVFEYTTTNCLGIQGHPEFPGYDKYTEWCRNKVAEFLLETDLRESPANQSIIHSTVERN